MMSYHSRQILNEKLLWYIPYQRKDGCLYNLFKIWDIWKSQKVQTFEKSPNFPRKPQKFHPSHLMKVPIGFLISLVKHSDLNLTVLLENNRHFADMLTDLTFHNDYGVFIIVNNGAGEDDLLFGASHWCPIDIGDIKTESVLEKL